MIGLAGCLADDELPDLDAADQPAAANSDPLAVDAPAFAEPDPLVIDGATELEEPGVEPREPEGLELQLDEINAKLSNPPQAFETEHQDPNKLYIEDIATGGTGCPDPETVTTLIASDGSSFLILFDEMEINYPPGKAVQNKTCSAGIKLHIPGGYQVALATVNTRGYAYLDKGIRARHTSKYFFAGNPIAFTPHAVLYGPFDDLYDFTDEVPFESKVWSKCGGSAIFTIQTILNINARKNPGGQAIFSNDTLDGQFQQLYHLQWKKC